MIIEIDDAWAEHELERQLKSLTPIDDLEEAEHKLHILKCSKDDEYLTTETQDDNLPVTEELLPDSAELFLSLIQRASNAVELELQECQTLVDKQIEHCVVKTESEGDEEEWEEELLLTNSIDLAESPTSPNEDNSSCDQKNTEPVLKKYQLKPQLDLPIYKVDEFSGHTPPSLFEQQKAEMDAENERKIKEELERGRKMEEERKRLEALQQEELRKIQEEMRLAEEALQKELQEHEQKIKQLNDRLLLEKKLHEEEVKRLEEENLKKRHLSAAKIQAHFRGMRTRRKHKEELDRRIEVKKKELMEEQLKYYEELIRKEKEAVEAELEQRRLEEEEKKREEQRAEEIRLRHLEKMKKKEEEELKMKLELEEKRRTKEKEEEERTKLMSAQVLHWLKENENQSDGNNSVKKIPLPAETESISATQATEQASAISAAATRDNHTVENFQNAHCNDGNPASMSTNPVNGSCLNENLPSNQKNLNEVDAVDNFNENQNVALDNKSTPKPSENDNDRKGKGSFLGSIATKAKNFFKSSSSINESSNETVKVKGNEKIASPAKLSDNSVNGSIADDKPLESQTKGSDEIISIDTVQSKTNEVQIEPDLANCEDEACLQQNVVELKNPAPESVSNLKGSQEPELPQLNQTDNSFSSQISEDEKLTHLSLSEKPSVQKPVDPTPEPHNEYCSNKSEPHNEHCSNKPSPVNRSKVHYKTNPLSYSMDMSLQPHPPEPKLTASLDFSRPCSRTSPIPTKANPQAAKNEYRRKRKLREDVTLARQISDVSRSASPTKNKTNSSKLVNWELFLREFETKYREWRETCSSWSEHPRPPSTANSNRNRHPSNKHSQIVPRVVNNSCVVDGFERSALTNPACREVYVRGCTDCEITVERVCREVELLSLQQCSKCLLNIVDSQIRYLDITESGLTELGKLPGTLVMLDMSRNSISRLSPLSCSSLVKLTLSHNRLVSTRGLQYLPNLIYLDLSYNNLSNVQHLDKCGLLQYLDLSHNQLVSVPNLNNNPLLSSLDLSANGLTSLDELSVSWLPCLQKLKLVANGLSCLPVLYRLCPLLKWLDVSNNMLFDTQEFIGCLEYCQLNEVVCDGTELDQDTINEYVQSISSLSSPDFTIVKHFIEIQRKLELQSLVDSSTIILDKGEHVIKLQESAKALRHHIVNNTLSDLSTCSTTASETEQTNSQNVEIVNINQNDDMKGKFGEKLAENSQENDCRTISGKLDDKGKSNNIWQQKDHPPLSTRVTKTHTKDTKDSTSTSDIVMTSRDVVMTSRESNMMSRDTSVLMLQSLLRGFVARVRYKNKVEQARLQVYREYQAMYSAARVIQRYWRGYSIRNMLWQWLPWLHRRKERLALHHKFATKIQSVYRGYLLRRRLAEVFEQAAYDLSDCEDLDEIGSLEFDETECERGWELPPTPSLQHHIPLPPSRSSSLLPPSRSSSLSQRSITDLSQGPVPLLPLNKLKSRDTTRPNSLRSVSDISVLSLPPSRRLTPSKRHVAMAAEWGVSNQDTVHKLVQRSKKFGSHMSEKKKRELIRKKILEGSKRASLIPNTPPPPTAGSAMSSDSVLYQWDVPSLQHQTSRHSKHSKHSSHTSLQGKQALHTQIYRNPKFTEPAGNMRLPPLV